MVVNQSELMLSSELIKLLPKNAEITRIEYEGPTLAIYTRNPLLFYEQPSLISLLASRFKRRLLIRSEPTERKDPSEAIQKIEFLLSNNGVPADQCKIFFDEIRGEVIIFIPEYLSNEKRNTLFLSIIKETKWIPIIKRYLLEVPKVFSKIYYKPRTKKEPMKFLSSVGNRVFRQPMNPSKNIRITALGGAEEVGRSALLVSTTESKILIDFGIKVNVGKREHAYPRLDLLDILINEIDAIIVTHAHLDHSGLVPFLYKHGYRGPVYMTEPTLPLSVLLQEDLVNILTKSGFSPPYNERDINTMIRHTIPLRYNQVTDVAPDIKLTFFNAGHILGSALVHLHITEGYYNLLITGDFKFGRTRLLNPAKYNFTRVETLIMESTYGGRHDILPNRKEVETLFSILIKKALDRGGKVLIPVPGVGRAQEILTVLHSIFKSKTNNINIPGVPVYIDGMIDEANKIHAVYLDYLKSDLREVFKETGDNPFNTDYLVPVDTLDKRDEVIRDPSPSIIVSTSGMMQGGPVIEYFKNLASDERNLLLFVTYQSPESLGRRLVEGVKSIDLMENGRMVTININMEVQKVDGFTGHSDRRQLIGYVSRLQNLLKNIYLVHGEVDKIHNLAATLQRFFNLPSSKLPLYSTIYIK